MEEYDGMAEILAREAEALDHEAEVYYSTYQMWDTTNKCPQCGSVHRHGIPDKWVACADCGNEKLED